MRHDPASAAIVIMLRSLKMPGMAQAVGDLIEQGAPTFDAAVPMLSQLLKAEMDLSRFDAAPLIAFTATKETGYGTETNRRI